MAKISGKPEKTNRKKSRKSDGPELFTLEEAHGARELPSVLVNGYSLMVRDKDGFAGDRASQTAFRELLEEWRVRRREKGSDPFPKVHSRELSKTELDRLLAHDKASEGADLLHGVIEEFAENLAMSCGAS